MEVLRVPTSSAWLPQAVARLDDILIDHAHCEKKAAASAMSLVSSYPEHDVLVRRCCKLAQEELRHFAAVHRWLVKRGVKLSGDKGDPYAQQLLQQARHGPSERLVDRLLIFSLIEARSCERLALLGGALEGELGGFYRGLAKP